MGPTRDARSIGDLLRDLGSDAVLLIRQELRLARTEVQENVRHSMQSLIVILAGGLMGFAGFIVLLSAAVDGLILYGIERWLAELIVGGGVVLVGLIIARGGQKALEGTDLAPQRATASVRRDVDMLKEQVT